MDTVTLRQLRYVELMLRWPEPLPGSALARARQLRGAIAALFADNDLFHQRNEQGKQLYRYPLVQYRWREGFGVIAGWEAAVEPLLRLPWLDLSLTLGEEAAPIIDVALMNRRVEFAVAPRLCRYRLQSPTLLFNQDNYQRYQLCCSESEQHYERDRLLVAQLLGALRGLEVEFPDRLYAAFTEQKAVKVTYKQQHLIGITGELATNAVLPSGFAFGHGTSHGFGWITAL